jgi:hypothetical protein
MGKFLEISNPQKVERMHLKNYIPASSNRFLRMGGGWN